MQTLRLALALAVGLAAPAPVLAQASRAEPVGPERVQKLIKDLGSSRFAERAKAQQELKRIGEPALDALQKAARSDDAETSRAAGELVKFIHAKRQTTTVMAPKQVRLNVKDMPVREAVAELAKQSGYTIELQGDAKALAGRKVTLDTGTTTFWEAFDQLCEKAGLIEAAPANPYGGNPYGPNPFDRVPRPRFKIQPAPPPGILPPAPPIVPPEKLNAPAVQGQGNVLRAVPAVRVQAIAPAVAVQAPVAAPPVQVVPLPAPAVQVGGQPALPGRVQVGSRPFNPYMPVSTADLVVQPGTPKKLPTCYAGAVRIRAIPAPDGFKPAKGEKSVWLEVTAEPRLRPLTLSGEPQLKKAVDDQGQALAPAPAAAPNPTAPPGVAVPAIAGPWGVNPYNPYSTFGAPRQVVRVRLKPGEKPAKVLKELSGTLTAQVLAPPEVLLKIDNVLKAAGKSVKGEHGGSLEVVSITKEDNGDYRVQVRMENPPAQNVMQMVPVQQALPGGKIVIQQVQVQIQIGGGGAVAINGGTPGNAGTPVLQDKNGKAYQLIAIPSRGMRGINNVFTHELTMVFRANAGQGEPARLVVNGQRTIAVPVAFRLENVPLR
jgi:hypothetical protein